MFAKSARSRRGAAPRRRRRAAFNVPASMRVAGAAFGAPEGAYAIRHRHAGEKSLPEGVTAKTCARSSPIGAEGVADPPQGARASMPKTRQPLLSEGNRGTRTRPRQARSRQQRPQQPPA